MAAKPEIDRHELLALRSRRGRVALAATVAGSAMASLDATIVNVAVLPHIGADLDAGLSALQWVLTGYLLALASLVLLGGALGDRYGRRRIFVIGTTWFAVASVLCGAAPTVEVLVAARLLQGVGAGLLTPGSLAILQASFREDDRAAAVGAWSGFGGVAGALGPVVGGTLVDGPGWRWAFLLNVPIAAITVVCARRAVPETSEHEHGGRLDYPGALLCVLGLAAGTWALTEAGPRGWGDPSVVAAGSVSIVALSWFVRHLRHTRHPLLPPSLFRNRTFSAVNAQTALLYGSLGVSFFLVAYELQVVVGWTALESSLALMPATVLMFFFSTASGSLARRIGPRLQLTVGPVFAAVGLLLLARIGPGASWVADVLPGAVVFGIGLVTFVAPLTATVMAAADPDRVSIASGVNNAVARTASLAALAFVPAISGLSVAEGPIEVTDAFGLGMNLAAVAALAAGPLAFFGLGRARATQRPPR